jgi:hypothetical protein
MLLNVDLASATVISKVPHMPAILTHGKGAPSSVDICPPSGSLRGFFYQTQKRQVGPYCYG